MPTPHRPAHTALALLVALALGAVPAAADPSAYTVDKTHSAILFKISHLGAGYVWGRFNDFNGALVLDAADPAKCSVEVDIRAESIDTGNEERDKHLRSKDFFDVENNPSIAFRSTKVEKVKDGEFRVTGDFTLLGVTRAVTFRMDEVGEADDPWGNHRVGFEGQLVIRRSDHGMKHMLPMIGDEVHIHLAVEGMRKK
jgi:polyisoprenoid-binding protein YceI